MRHNSERLNQLEKRMLPTQSPPRLVVIWDDQPDADSLEGEALARGDKVLRVMFADPRTERPATR